ARPTSPRSSLPERGADAGMVGPSRRLSRALPCALRQALHHPSARLAALRHAERPGGGQAGLHRPARGPASRRGRTHPRAGGRAQLGHPPRRGATPRAAKAHAARLPRRADGASHGTDHRGRRARGSAMAARRAGGPALTPPGDDARDHPACGLRPRSGAAARRAAGKAHRHPRARGAPERDAAVPSARPRSADAVRALRPPAGRDRRAAVRADRRAPGRGRGARRRPRHAARGPPRGRLRDVRPGAPRRAHDPARRRPRDHCVGARVGARAARPRARRPGPPGRGGRRRRPGRRRLPDRNDPGDPTPAAGAPQRRPAAGQAAGRDRRADLPDRCLRGRAVLPPPPRPRDLRRSLRLPARALSRRAARHLHLDPVRRRSPSLSRRELRHARDEGGAACGPGAGRGALRPRRAGVDPPALDHPEPGARRGDGAARADRDRGL
ncbi:MAG: hypothetical protein AVDCRST_MAG45-881, partial [uncultured Solirubrobacterales bacterium]